MLKIQGEDQVTLKVTVAEVSRQVMKAARLLRFPQSGLGRRDFVPQSVNLGNAINPWPPALPMRWAGRYFRLCERDGAGGVMRTLAEPSLTAFPPAGQVLRRR